MTYPETEVRVYTMPDGRCPFDDWLARLRVHHGPGYRVYFGRQGRAVVMLLCAGDKRTQPRDIARAKRYWREHRNADSPLS